MCVLTLGNILNQAINDARILGSVQRAVQLFVVREEIIKAWGTNRNLMPNNQLLRLYKHVLSTIPADDPFITSFEEMLSAPIQTTCTTYKAVAWWKSCPTLGVYMLAPLKEDLDRAMRKLPHHLQIQLMEHLISQYHVS